MTASRPTPYSEQLENWRRPIEARASDAIREMERLIGASGHDRLTHETAGKLRRCAVVLQAVADRVLEAPERRPNLTTCNAGCCTTETP